MSGNNKITFIQKYYSIFALCGHQGENNNENNWDYDWYN